MHRKTLFVITATLMFLSFPSRSALAQSDVPKLEFGAQYTLLQHSVGDTTDSGVGGRIGFNFTKHVGIEGEINFFPQKRRTGIYIDRQEAEGLFGVKVGTRSDKVGIFGKLRPGFLFISKGQIDPLIKFVVVPPPPVSQTLFALDFGGVLEVYPSRHILLRFDVGDTVIRFTNSSVDPLSFTFFRHNLQFSTGVGFRF